MEQLFARTTKLLLYWFRKCVIFVRTTHVHCSPRKLDSTSLLELILLEAVLVSSLSIG